MALIIDVTDEMIRAAYAAFFRVEFGVGIQQLGSEFRVTNKNQTLATFDNYESAVAYKNDQRMRAALVAAFETILR